MMRNRIIFFLISLVLPTVAWAGVPVDTPSQDQMSSGAATDLPALSIVQPLTDIGPPNGFLETEARLKAVIAISEETRGGDLALARYYAANGLEAEALHVMENVDATLLSCDDRILKAKLNYTLRRYHAVIDESAFARCSDVAARDQLAASAAAAWSRLGAYRKALTAIEAASPMRSEVRTEDITSAILEARILAGDEGAHLLRSDIDRLHRSADRQLLSMLLASREGDRRAARSHGAALEKAASAPEAQMRARIMLARLDLEEGKDSLANVTARLDRLALAWRGGAGERELRDLAMETAARAGDIAAALASSRQLIDQAPFSDAAERVAETAGALLPKLFERAESDTGVLPPARAAAVFFDYVEFAPPGAKGDELIRSVASDLAEIGLYGEAQKLLAHQVFNRLRGAERATQASMLAAFYLEDAKPAEALLALRRTRIEGLSQTVNAERLRLEVEALTRLGDADAALAALARDEALEGASALRAGILWRMKSWPLASAAYIDAARSAEGSDFDQFILRAATAAVLAGDDNTLQEITTAHSTNLSDSRVRELVDALGGDVSSPAFLEAYHAAFSERSSGI